jgi:hypothetical protein
MIRLAAIALLASRLPVAPAAAAATPPRSAPDPVIQAIEDAVNP